MLVGVQGISVALLYMCNGLPAEKGEQMILTSFSDVITTWLVHLGEGIKGKHTRASALLSGFLELNILLTSNKATNAL